MDNEGNSLSDEIRLASGRTIYANNLIIGIGPDLSLHGGYDQSIPKLTVEETVELADMAIARWQALKIKALED